MRDDFFDSNVCMRCGKESIAITMSMFNTDRICMECQEIERGHSDYEKAREADLAQIRSGNYNFAGIGKPTDL